MTILTPAPPIPDRSDPATFADKADTFVAWWAQLVADVNAGDWYGAANILGTVSQSGGVPTGAIIESGSNANGFYVRFANGTQICSHSIDLGGRTANGSGTYASPYRTTEATWTFPATFSANPIISLLPRIDTATGPARNASPAFRTISTTQITGILFSSVSSDTTSVSVIAHMVATGRWF